MSATIDETTHRIDGSRTTVYHVMDYYVENDPVDSIARELRLSIEQVRAAIAFIESHKVVVQANYQKMLDRDERGNSPEVEAILARNREKFLRLKEELKARAHTCC